MTCRKCRKQLSAFLDGELPARLAAQLEAHLESCQACADQRDRMVRAVGLVDRLPRIAPSEGFDQSFARRLKDARQERPEVVRPPRRWRLPILAAAAAGACAVALLAVVFLRTPPPAASDLELAQHLELLQDYEVVEHLDALQDYEVVMNLDELEAIR